MLESTTQNKKSQKDKNETYKLKKNKYPIVSTRYHPNERLFSIEKPYIRVALYLKNGLKMSQKGLKTHYKVLKKSQKSENGHTLI